MEVWHIVVECWHDIVVQCAYKEVKLSIWSKNHVLLSKGFKWWNLKEFSLPSAVCSTLTWSLITWLTRFIITHSPMLSHSGPVLYCRLPEVDQKMSFANAPTFLPLHAASAIMDRSSNSVDTRQSQLSTPWAKIFIVSANGREFFSLPAWQTYVHCA